MVETRSSVTLRVRNRSVLKNTNLLIDKPRKRAQETIRVISKKRKNFEPPIEDTTANAQDGVAVSNEQTEKPNEDLSPNATIASQKKTRTEDVDALPFAQDSEATESDAQDFQTMGDVSIPNEQESESAVAEGPGVNDTHQSASQNFSGSSLGASGSEICGDDARGSNNPKTLIHFNDKGQPIEEGSASFTTQLGLLMRKHCPISYERWPDVPVQTKDKIWKLVTDDYIVPAPYKGIILQKIHTSWKNLKSSLLAKHYDKYGTDEERKRNRPIGINQDHWNIFVDNQSKPSAQARRKVGKLARQAMKTPHTSGRRGAARTAEALKKGNPLATVTRTDLYLALHSRKDGSCPTPEQTKKVEQIKAITQKDPSSVNLDINHDPVRQVCGPDKSGVRGLGTGVSKTKLIHSAPFIDQLQKEKKSRVSAEEQIADLRQKVDQLLRDRRSCLSDENQRDQVSHLQQERDVCSSGEHQNDDPREHVVSQSEQIQGMNRLQQERRSHLLAEEHQNADPRQQGISPSDQIQGLAITDDRLQQEQLIAALRDEVDQLQLEKRSWLSIEEQIADLRRQSNLLQQEKRLRLSSEKQIADLRKQVDLLQRERNVLCSAEQQIADLREQVTEQVTSQGLMITDLRELMIRLCS